ncbi:MAG: hypothetical protein H7Z18_04535 [Methylophilaceae bacterium]|nr:hypothetical protein [Methylophilaceae bacterium]
MEILKNLDESHFGDYLLYDLWPPVTAWALLAGFDWFEDIEYLSEFISFYNEFEQGYEDEVRCHAEEVRIYRLKRENLRRLKNFWVSGEKGEDSQSPKYFIDWALSKRFLPYWLDWAIEQKLYVPMNEANKVQTIIFDTISTYPPELDLAIKAWQAVSASEGKGKPKAQIRAWLDANAKELSNEAKERISIVCNWDKLGGATRTD